MSTPAIASKSILPKECTLEIHEYPHAYEISRRSASQWKQKKTDPRKQPKTINSSRLSDLSVISRWNAGDRIGNVEIQYVPGAPTIFRNDYLDREGNPQPGLKKLYSTDELMKDQYRRAVNSGIAFVDGFLFLDNFGGKDNRLLLDYVYHHALNESGPGYKPQRDINSILLFKAFEPEKKAVITLQGLDLEKRASELFYNIRDGKGVYNVPLLNALLGMYDLGGGLGADDLGQKMLQLAPFYRLNPTKFITDFDKHTEEYRMAIGTAEKLGVLVNTSKDAKLKIGADLMPLMEFKKETEDQRVESLVYHFLGDPAGMRDYSKMIGESDVKKVQALK